MRRILILIAVFTTITAFRSGWCEDNLLAIDVITDKQAAVEPKDKTVQENPSATEKPVVKEEIEPADGSEEDLARIKAYHEVFDNKQKELELIKLDLEKSNLLLKKKEAEKEIFQIEKLLPQGKKEDISGFVQGLKEPLVDASDIKIQLLLVSDDLKEAQISLKGINYAFKEGDNIASRLDAKKIDPTGITFKQQDGSVLRINFVN